MSTLPTLVARSWPLLVLFGVGLVFFGIAGVLLWKTWEFTSHARSTMGKVERLERREDTSPNRKDRMGPTYAPVFSFRDDVGREHVVAAAVSEGKSSYAVGQEVPVLYEPDHPEEARIHSFAHLWAFPMAFGVMGIACLGMGAIGWQKTVARKG